MRHKGFLAVLLFASLSCAAQTTTTLYDNFNQRFINEALWFSACGGFSVTENCATDIRFGEGNSDGNTGANGQLHLARGMTGNSNSNTGTNYGTAEVFFVNPVPIKSITADITLLNAEVLTCAANSAFSFGQAIIIARFFNAGNGTESDDVGASISVGRSAFTPEEQLDVSAGFFHNGDFSHNLFLGNIPIGTPITATVAWDKANHQFVFSWTNKLTHVTTPGVLSYSFSDTTPAADPEKHLNVEIFPANCTATRAWVSADALFDNVFIGQ